MTRAVSGSPGRRALQVDGWEIVVKGRWLKTAFLFDEDWYDRPIMADPGAFATEMRRLSTSMAEPLPLVIRWAAPVHAF